MNMLIHSFSNYSFTQLQEKFTPAFTDIQKKITAIALIALGCLAIFCVATHFCHKPMTKITQFTDLEGTTYKGVFKDGIHDKDHLNGYGKITYQNEEYYEGEFTKGKLNGKGKAVTSKVTYEGVFKEDNFHGLIKQSYPDGTIFEGHYQEGILDGDAKVIYTNGEIVEAPFKDGIQQGKGKMTFANGETFEDETNIE